MERIESLSQFLDCVGQIKNEKKTTADVRCSTLYRGQADISWNLSPSLCRSGLFHVENLLMRELYHVCPEEFGNDRFDNLVKMQHFGLPTRLLDVTTNPLVALYFACNKLNNNNGTVFIFPNMPVSWSSSPIVELFMKFTYENGTIYTTQSQLVSSFLQEEPKLCKALHISDDVRFLQLVTHPAYAVMPLQSNARIKAQDGVFFLFGISLEKQGGVCGSNRKLINPIECKTPQEIWKSATQLVIPYEKKDAILYQLDLIGINEKKLFPDLSHIISHTVEHVRKYALNFWKDDSCE